MTGLTFGKPDPRLPYGQCWVCGVPDSVPVPESQLIPALCGEGCKARWVRLLDTAAPSDRCSASTNLGEPHADALCQLPPSHEGHHVDGDVSWGWDEKTGTGVINVHIPFATGGAA